MKFPSGNDFIKMIPLLIAAVIIDNFKVIALALVALIILFNI